MEDKTIVDLFWTRSENAISETDKKYGRYCRSIAHNILSNDEDAEECVNDTWLGAWNSIPPHRPAVLSTFLGKLTRRISLNRWKAQHAQKRGGGEIAIALEELSEIVPASGGVEEELEGKELSAAINVFLSTLPETERDVFVCRYWFLTSITDISRIFRFSQSKTKSTLYRTREKLKRFLSEEGFL